MTSIADLIDPAAIKKLGKPADLRLGEEIARQGGVEFIEFGPLLVRAKVGGVAAGSQRRTVMLQSTPAGLDWSCTCTRKTDHFCKHCVAAAIVTHSKA